MYTLRIFNKIRILSSKEIIKVIKENIASKGLDEIDCLAEVFSRAILPDFKKRSLLMGKHLLDLSVGDLSAAGGVSETELTIHFWTKGSDTREFLTILSRLSPETKFFLKTESLMKNLIVEYKVELGESKVILRTNQNKMSKEMLNLFKIN